MLSSCDSCRVTCALDNIKSVFQSPMSVRKKALIIFMASFSIMLLMMSFIASKDEPEKSSAERAGSVLWVSLIVAVSLAILYVGWDFCKDIEKGEENESLLNSDLQKIISVGITGSTAQACSSSDEEDTAVPEPVELNNIASSVH